MQRLEIRETEQDYGVTCRFVMIGPDDEPDAIALRRSSTDPFEPFAQKGWPTTTVFHLDGEQPRFDVGAMSINAGDRNSAPAEHAGYFALPTFPGAISHE